MGSCVQCTVCVQAQHVLIVCLWYIEFVSVCRYNVCECRVQRYVLYGQCVSCKCTCNTWLCHSSIQLSLSLTLSSSYSLSLSPSPSLPLTLSPSPSLPLTPSPSLPHPLFLPLPLHPLFLSPSPSLPLSLTLSPSPPSLPLSPSPPSLPLSLTLSPSPPSSSLSLSTLSSSLPHPLFLFLFLSFSLSLSLSRPIIWQRVHWRLLIAMALPQPYLALGHCHWQAGRMKITLRWSGEDFFGGVRFSWPCACNTNAHSSMQSLYSVWSPFMQCMLCVRSLYLYI